MRTLKTALESLRTTTHYARGGRKGRGNRAASRLLHKRDLRVESLEQRTLLSVGGVGDQASYLVPKHDLYQSGGYLSEPSTGKPLDIAMSFLKSHAALLGVSPADISDSIVTDQYASPDTGMTHIYLRQEFNGLEVANANMNVNITADGRVLSVGGGFVAGLSSLENAALTDSAPRLTAPLALQQIVGKLGLTSKSDSLTVLSATSDRARSTTLSDSDLSLDSIPAKLQYVATAHGVQLAWDYVLRTPDGKHWYDVSADGSSATVVALSDWIDNASYTVFALPTENPDDGARTTVVDPQSPTASPYGWHDTNGVAGPEYTDTRGNNVDAQDDWDANDTGGARPDGGSSLTFNYPIDYTQDPHTYVSAATTNLFYWNNTLHDIHYAYGFTEAAGNFQQNDYGKGGIGGDPVQADCQDGSGTDNANFGTPPDGQSPRMQMYEFVDTTPYRDGDLESTIMIHEYGHGVSNRLVGGPSNVDALDALQSGGMGEGWGDWWALMLTQKPTDTKLGSYPMGTYVIGESPTGGGIREYPYSFNMSVDPHTYGDYNTDPEVHDAGEIWCSTLWDMTWLLIDAHGYSSDIAHGYDPAIPGRNAGNNLALQLVMDSLEIMPANPSFLDARDALLAADQALTGGANATEIWTAFARRGMGFSAYDGGSANATVVTQAFDMPPVDPLVMSSTPTGGTTSSVSNFQFVFSEAMDPASFTVADDVASFTGPGGANLKGQITGATWVDNKTLRVNFNSQSAVGTYTMVIGPQILAADNHDPMDQDRDGILGEVPGDQYTATVTVLEKFFSQNMDVNPGWTISGGEWAFGHPTGGGGTSFGYPDPSNGYTGSNVYGVNLNGDYNTSVGGPYYLTTTVIDCSNYSDVTLDFQRWLNSDWGSYVSATVDVWNGTTWTNIYTNPATSTVTDSTWQHMTYPIGAYADGKGSVKIRWGYQVLQSSDVYPLSGWNIDDVNLEGIPVGPDVTGPRVTSQNPTGTVVTAQTTLQFGFSEAMDTSSFNVAADVVSFTGPSGDLKSQITGFTWINNQTLQVQFASQSTMGTYNMVIGPNITDDAPSFNVMDQNNNGINGEIPGDQYTATFQIVAPIYSAYMDVNPGWTLDAGTAPYLWQYGTPTGVGGDPASGHTGSNVIGYNLAGQYPNNLSTTQYATTPAFSTVGYTDVKLGFWRWLGVETSSYDHANVQVWDGAAWTTLWSNSTTLTDTSWSYQEFALPASACGQPQVKIRWGMGTSDTSVTYCGWNIDDVTVLGTPTVSNGQIQGDNWNDLDYDGVRDAGEPTLAGWTVYLDTDNDGTLDPGEPSQITDASGHYVFANLPAGTYTVREVPQTGWIQTAPAAGDYSVTLAPSDIVTGKDFGNVFDTIPPSVTINQAATQPDPTRSSSINFTVVFSESVADFATGDVSFTGSTTPGTLLGTVTGSGTTYNVAVTGMTGCGCVIASIAAGNAHDAAGNPSTASTSTDNTVTFDNVSPTVTSSAPSTAGPTDATSLTFTVAFSEPVVNVSTAGFRLTATGTAAGTIASVSASSGTSFTVTVNSVVGDGTLRLDLKSFTTIKDLAGNVAIGYSGGSTATIDNTAPTVTGVLVASTAWQSAFLASLGGVGYAIPSGSNQVLSLPWENLNEIIVQFSENVSVAQANMALVGVNVPNYTFAPNSFVYDAVAHRATWTVSQYLGVDKLLIDLDGSTAGAVADAAGNRLDGEWTNPTWAPPAAPVGGRAWPSGDGTPGGNFLFRFNVLPGDADQNGMVNFADLNVVLMHFNNQAGNWMTGDFTGDGVTNFADLSAMLTNFNQTLPVVEPTPPAGSSFAAVALPIARTVAAPKASIPTASTATAVWDAALVDVSLQLKQAVSVRSEVSDQKMQ